MNENELDTLLEGTAEPSDPSQEEQFQKRVRRTMHRALYGRVLACILLVCVAAAGLFFGVSWAMNHIFYAPSRETSLLQPDETRPSAEFNLLLADTLATLYPGKTCWVLGQPESLGFGRYEIDLLLKNTLDLHVLGGPADACFTIGFSHLDTGNAPLHIELGEFIDPTRPDLQPLYHDSLDTIRQELSGLPRSAVVDVSISLPQTLTSDAVAALMRDYPAAQVNWLALAGQGWDMLPQVAGGMFVRYFAMEALTPAAQAAYPCYYLPEEITGQALEQCLVSRLEVLADHPDFVALMQTAFGDMLSPASLHQRLENARAGWACYGLRLTTDPETLTALMDSLSPTQVVIHDVKVSRYQK